MELLQPFDMALAPHVKGGRCLPMVMFRQARCFINFLGRGPHVLIGPHVHMQVLVYLYATRCSMNLSRDNQQPQFSNIGLDSSRFNCLFLGYVHTEREKRFAVASVCLS